MPAADKLPGRLGRLAGLNAVRVSSETFHADVERLMGAIAETMNGPGPVLRTAHRRSPTHLRHWRHRRTELSGALRRTRRVTTSGR